MAESKNGHNFAIQGPTEKIIRVRLFFVLMLCIKFQVPSSSFSFSFIFCFTTNKRRNGQTDRRTDGQAQTHMPPQLLRSWGHKNAITDKGFFTLVLK